MDSTLDRAVEIEFLCLDKADCGRCVASDASLREAMALLRPVLDIVGVRVDLRTVHVASAAQAEALRLVSSPTIRVGGADIAGMLAETGCTDCTALSAGGELVGCRVWHYRGQQYTDAPAALIIDAVLGHLYGHSGAAPGVLAYGGLPGNLRQFFGGGDGAAC